jgi:hypothetical protein
VEDLSLVKAGIEVGVVEGLSLLEPPQTDLASMLLCMTLEDGAVVLLMLLVLESGTGSVVLSE